MLKKYEAVVHVFIWAIVLILLYSIVILSIDTLTHEKTDITIEKNN